MFLICGLCSHNLRQCVWQVYKGVLRETGETVAVKVQRPGIGDNIAIDMLLLRQLMGVVDKNQTIVSVLSIAGSQTSCRFHQRHDGMHLNICIISDSVTVADMHAVGQEQMHATPFAVSV